MVVFFYCFWGKCGHHSTVYLMTKPKVTGCGLQMGHLLTDESSWTPKTQPNNSRAVVWLSIWRSTLCRRPSWTSKIQPNGAVRRRLVEFLVFNSIHQLKSTLSDVAWRRKPCKIRHIFLVDNIKMVSLPENPEITD